MFFLHFRNLGCIYLFGILAFVYRLVFTTDMMPATAWQ